MCSRIKYTKSGDSQATDQTSEQQTFHQFSRLPAELRIQIWQISAHPRNVHLSSKGSHESTMRVTTSTPPPPVVQTCHESRTHSAYNRTFATSADQRYIWINFECDLISIPDDNLRALQAYRAEIELLSFVVEDESTYDDFCYYGAGQLQHFPLLREIQVIVGSCMLLWATIFTDCHWGSCLRSNIRFVDRWSGLVVTGAQLEMINDWGTFHSRDGGEGFDQDESHSSLGDLQLVG
jgi:hypothetical protein